jgi:hypothetical protein
MLDDRPYSSHPVPPMLLFPVMSPAVSLQSKKFIRLPCSSTRAQRPYAHLKLLTAVRPGCYSVAFEGEILAPGALIDVNRLPVPAVVLECAGPMGEGHGHRRREVLWILWLYDWPEGEWVELARAAAVNWEWTLTLREPAIRALHPRPDLIDVLDRGRAVAGAIMDAINRRVEDEIEPVRANALNAVYDQIASRLAMMA